MVIEIPEFLNAEELNFLHQLYAALPVQPGHHSAGDALHSAKKNEELDLGTRANEVRQVVLGACNRLAPVTMVVLPRFVSSPILSRYEAGMGYGNHTDSAFGQEGSTVYRTDFSCTVFLDDPASYDGGELSISADTGIRAFKAPAGGAVFYPTLYDHEVRPVTRGVRRACVFWVQSMVRDPRRRQILLDVTQVAEWMSQHESMDSDARRAVIRTRENLLRMWLEN